MSFSRFTMAPNGHAASGRKSTHKSSDSSSVFWEDKHGHREFMDWKEANQNGPSPSYEEWVESQKMTGGLSLYYTALSMFEESDSTVGHCHNELIIPYAKSSRTKRPHLSRPNLKPPRLVARLVGQRRLRLPTVTERHERLSLRHRRPWPTPKTRVPPARRSAKRGRSHS